jgi:hypothetical protein
MKKMLIAIFAMMAIMVGMAPAITPTNYNYWQPLDIGLWYNKMPQVVYVPVYVNTEPSVVGTPSSVVPTNRSNVSIPAGVSPGPKINPHASPRITNVFSEKDFKTTLGNPMRSVVSFVDTSKGSMPGGTSTISVTNFYNAFTGQTEYMMNAGPTRPEKSPDPAMLPGNSTTDINVAYQWYESQLQRFEML